MERGVYLPWMKRRSSLHVIYYRTIWKASYKRYNFRSPVYQGFSSDETSDNHRCTIYTFAVFTTILTLATENWVLHEDVFKAEQS